MFIQKGTVSLRALEPDDASNLFQWENDMSVWEVSETRVPFSRFQIEQFILGAGDIYSSKQLRMMIDVQSADMEVQTVGNIDLYDFDPYNSRAGIGIYIIQSYRNQGIGSTALQLCLSYSFNTLNLHQLYCFILHDNQASIRLFEKIGFVKTGIRKDWIYRPSGFVDQIQYQLFKSTYS
ncbi:MAG: GNAT family N-acetyltransferase [Bacteroidales bacterium]|jgi:diamine N-acetyltransferase|nr:GNAT family N-acetyltransferase [Bacteroidales bacterium]MDD3700229.1 GNAT family N-acetyltransferase [Bacteroidales bacterium]MDY0370647.1 GNAT family N-acetyltransferase [Bacteroidales bacterium]